MPLYMWIDFIFSIAVVIALCTAKEDDDDNQGQD